MSRRTHRVDRSTSILVTMMLGLVLLGVPGCISGSVLRRAAHLPVDALYASGKAANQVRKKAGHVAVDAAMDVTLSVANTIKPGD